GPASSAVLAAPLPANDRRQDYLRATLSRRGDGALVATPFDRQDSSMLATLAHADCLVVRPPLAPAAAAGALVEILRFPTGAGGL
ncbi:MAG: molybdopterin molybdenumtransferase MoeA, partial [Alphaproteobacteria bacterium]|nr:molybdopterin molybdenumtransferase MoeA [Alphaproteobacteria bacterium]